MHRFAPVLLVCLFAGCAGGNPTAPDASYQIYGRIIDGAAGLPLDKVALSVLDGANLGKATVTAPDGRYTLDNVVSGTFTLRAVQNGYEEFQQSVTITSRTNIDIRMTPQRAVNSGWSGGSLFAQAGKEQIGARVTTVQVARTGTNLEGSFTTADGGSGTFGGIVLGTTFTGWMRLEMVFGTPTRRCHGSSGDVGGSATPTAITLSTPGVQLEDCAGPVTNVVLTITP
jgi:hypothetical protein